MDILVAIVVLVCGFSVFEAIRKLNNNVIEQTEELKKLRQEVQSIKEKTR